MEEDEQGKGLRGEEEVIPGYGGVRQKGQRGLAVASLELEVMAMKAGNSDGRDIRPGMKPKC